MYLRTWAKTIDKMELLCFNKFTINSIFFYNILSENRKYKNSAVLLNATASTNCFVSRTLRGESTAVILGYVTCFHWCQGIGDDLLLCGEPLLHILDSVEAPLHICVHGAALLHVLAIMNLGEAVSPYYIPWPRTAREGTKAPSNRFWKINHIFTSPHFTSLLIFSIIRN